MRRLALLTLLVSLLATGVAEPAAATGDCAVHTTGLRYRPTITWMCAGAVTSVTSVVVTRVSNGAAVGTDAIAGVGTAALSLALHGDLASGVRYQVDLHYDDGNGPMVATNIWRTLPPPAHPALHVKVITAIPADAVLDIAHRLDLANIFAVPRPADFVDASTRSLTAAQYASALRRHQSALVVTDEHLLGSAGLATALARYCNAGHGVVLGGQTHWIAGTSEAWTGRSAIGSPSSAFAARWSMFSYDNVSTQQMTSGPRVLATSSIIPNFLTKGLTRFTVVGPGSGEPYIQDYFSGRVLASLQRASSSQSPFFSAGQVFLAARQIGAGRLVDLGFRPWSSAVDQGGFDPSQSPGGALTARALWWATNRIPPTDTHFTTTPARSSDRATVFFTMAAKDQDKQTADDLHYRYRIGAGSWHRAVSDSFVMYHLAQGRTYTVYARAFDSGGNVDPHVARYTFRVLPGALG
jgi:hypothetical protein